ncbi:MAG: 50S ribosomal protein L11 methyltransferase [Desulfovibrionaceae bacterium]|nr:50S ribosomal protein L11 methyltransferase [Desulfovibrionaceae bacterium]
MPCLLEIKFTVPASAEDDCAAFLCAKAPHGWQEESGESGVSYRLFLENHPLAQEIAAEISGRWPGCGLSLEQPTARDWTMAWREFFTPVSCGERFDILPPWLAKDRDNKLTAIVIEPKMAFGTGHHPSTALCLDWLADFHRAGRIARGQRFLDLGTGSGILGIGLCKLGLSGLGLDIDPQAVVCAMENAALNGVAPDMACAVGSVDCLGPGQRFAVIVANILSEPLRAMARDIVSLLAPDGCLVISGILAEQADGVAAAYTDLGLDRPGLKQDGEWTALAWAGALKGENP